MLKLKTPAKSGKKTQGEIQKNPQKSPTRVKLIVFETRQEGLQIQEFFNGVVDILRFRSYSPLLPTGKL